MDGIVTTLPITQHPPLETAQHEGASKVQRESLFNSLAIGSNSLIMTSGSNLVNAKRRPLTIKMLGT